MARSQVPFLHYHSKCVPQGGVLNRGAGPVSVWREEREGKQGDVSDAVEQREEVQDRQTALAEICLETSADLGKAGQRLSTLYRSQHGAALLRMRKKQAPRAGVGR